MNIRRADRADHEAILALWQGAELSRPWIDGAAELELKVATDPDGLLVAIVDDRVVGTVMVGFEGHRGWINYLAVDADQRRVGVGRRLMAAAEDHLRRLGAPKVNLQVRTSNAQVVAFYEALGYVHDDVVSLGRRLD